MSIKYKWLYERLKETIQHSIEQGIDRLPTEEELCLRYQFSRQTVRQALSLLEKQGLIEKRRGSGSYITGLSARPEYNKIAVLISRTEEYLYPQLLFDIRKELTAAGFSMDTFITENSIKKEREQLIAILSDTYRGVIAEGSKSALPNPNLDLYNEIQSRGIHLLFLHNRYAGLNTVPAVLDDNFGGGEFLARHLRSLGHTSIGCIFQMDEQQGLERYRGFVETMRNLNLPVEDSHIAWFDASDLASLEQSRDTRFIKKIVQEALGSCTAVICHNDQIAYFLSEELRLSGYSLPEDLAIASFDNTYLSNSGLLSLTTLTHVPHEMGRRAAQTMLRLCKGLPASTQIVTWSLMEREST